MSANEQRADTTEPDPSKGDNPEAGDTQNDGGETATELEPGARIEQLEQEVASLKDKWLRAVADLENYKKRVRRELDEATLRRVQELLQSFLPTVDNLERALETVGSKGDPEVQLGQLVKGIEMVRNEFVAALDRQGISVVPSVGEVFDPALHDALQQIPSPDHSPGVIIKEFEKGYRQGDRLLRPARVIVAGPGSSGGAQSGEEA